MATKSTKKKKTYRSMAAGTIETSEHPDYIRLRTILDSLEIGAIRYYLLADSGASRQRRFEELDAKLMPLINWVWSRSGGIDCPEGYVDCQGVCVPYPCVG